MGKNAWRDPELIGLPWVVIRCGHPWRRQGLVMVLASRMGVQCKLRNQVFFSHAAQPSKRPSELPGEDLFLEGAGTEIVGCYPGGVGGQVGEVPEAMSWGWLPRAPCACGGRSTIIRAATLRLLSAARDSWFV